MPRILLIAFLALIPSAAHAGDLSIIVSGQWLEKTAEDQVFEGVLEETRTDFDLDVGGALGFGFLYEWSDRWGLEAKASFGKMDVTVRRFLEDAEFILVLDAVEVIPITAVVQYRFRPSDSWTPYLGAGVAHVRFRNLQVQSISFDDDTGFVLNAGFDFALGEQWFINGDLKYVPFETGIEGASEAGRGEISFKPIIGSAGVRYRF
jgi:outer membrane protein W